MELERLEQKEMREYERKLDANKRLIDELGERVGQESRAKAELESTLQVLRKKCEDQAAQLSRVTELNSVHQTLFQDVKHDPHAAGGGKEKPWDLYQKLEDLMASHQKLVEEMDLKNDEVQQKRQEVSDQELLCIELSTQLDKLATQLNDADSEMAKCKTEAETAKAQAAKAQERMQMLEKSILQEEEENTNTDNNNDGETQTTGKAILLKQLQEVEELLKKVTQERDVSLHKATNLSIALATTREHNDALQEKLQYQNNIVDRFLGKSHRVAVPTTPSAVPANHGNYGTGTSPSNSRYSYSQPGNHIQSNTLPFPVKSPLGNTNTTTPTNSSSSNTRTPPARTSSKDGLFTGQRIRNFFANRRATIATNATAAATAGGSNGNSSNSNNNTPLSSPTPNAKPVKTDLDLPNPQITTTDTHNPFDDDDHDAFANPAVGKESDVAEQSQGGGGDVNLALTL